MSEQELDSLDQAPRVESELPIQGFYPEDAEYDPARRRRKWLFDPARRRTHRKGRMPAGLRRYWASKRKGGAYHPKHRRRHGRRLKLDPARRRGGHRRRRFDPAFGGAAGSYVDIGTDYAGVAFGSVLHNFIVQTKGFLSKQMALGPVQITQLGAVAGVGGILAEKFGWIRQNGFLSQILKGMFSESFNVPAVESTTRTTAGGTSGGSGMFGPLAPGPATMPQPWSQGMMGTGAQIVAGSLATPMSGPYYTPAWYGF